MPGDMAMERPDTRIVRRPLDDHVARIIRSTAMEQVDITTLRIERIGDDTVPGTATFGQDLEIVAVEMHGMDGAEDVADDEADGVGGAEIVDVPVRVVGVGGVALVGEEEERVVVVGAEGGAVDGPDRVAGSVRGEVDLDGLDGGWERVDGFGQEWNGLGEGVVGTDGLVVVGCGRGGCFARVGLFVVDGCESMWLVCERAWEIGDVGSHEDGIGGIAVGGDENVCSLGDSERDDVGLVGYDGHKVVRNHGHGMIVNGEFLNTFTTGIDQSKTMGFAGLEPEFRDACIRGACGTARDQGAVVVHFAVDEIVVGTFRGWRGHSLDFFHDLEVLLMVVVGEQDGPNVYIVRCVFGPVDDHSSEGTGDIL